MSRPTRPIRLLLALLLWAAFTLHASAAVKMPAIFGGGMVLQRDRPIPVWGWAAPGEKITVAFAGHTTSTAAGPDGAWITELPPLSASASSRTLTVAGDNTLTYADVLVGEVWICSGQSNMEMGIGMCNVPDEIAAASDPALRLLVVAKETSTTALRDLHTPVAWKRCTPDSILKGGWGGFSAAAYFFGRELRRRLDVPVGLIETCWGGTPAQAWTRGEVLADDEELNIYHKNWAESSARYAEDKKKHEIALAAWKKAGGKGWGPWPPQDPITGPSRPANLYNAMIAPLIPYAIRGAIWYQGESNANPAEAELYRRLFSTMIADWRACWGQGDFPFLFVQLANFMARKEQPADSSWARLRESQLKTLALPATGMAVCVDIGAAADIHPKDKLSVGRRLALAALQLAYGQEGLVFSGPIFDSIKVEGARAILSFKHAGGGLVSKAAGGLEGFAIAGEDKKFVWADAQIASGTVVVSSPQVSNPVAVRYGWADNPAASLYNQEGLPASPFRTDDWPYVAPPPDKPAKPAVAKKAGSPKGKTKAKRAKK